MENEDIFGYRFDYIIENEIATKEELKLVLSIKGYNEKTLTSVLGVRTGFDSFEQHKKFVELQNQSDDPDETRWDNIRESLNG
tara:strand:+ start:113 stop:361 length:249 start_codon:yes stop_codon:yes gene_type:complete